MQFFRRSSSACFNLCLSSVASFHNVLLNLDMPQSSNSRVKDLCWFSPCLYITPKKPEFFFFGIFTAFSGLVTTNLTSVIQSLNYLNSLQWRSARDPRSLTRSSAGSPGPEVEKCVSDSLLGVAIPIWSSRLPSYSILLWTASCPVSRISGTSTFSLCANALVRLRCTADARFLKRYGFSPVTGRSYYCWPPWW